MRLLAYIMAAAVALPGLAVPATAAPADDFARAQAQFDAARAKLVAGAGDTLEARRMFREAAGQFAAIAAGGIASANLYVNTGNAFHFAGDEPRALLWYLRAERLANTQEIRSGTATLRRLCKAELWSPPRASIRRVLMFWHYDLGRGLKQGLLLTLYPAGCFMVIIGLFRQRKARWLRAGMVLMTVGGIAGVSDAVAAAGGGNEWAVVVEQTKGYAGDGQMYSIIVESVTPGQEVKLIESRPEWVHVELPSGTGCWLPADSCEPVSLRHKPA